MPLWIVANSPSSPSRWMLLPWYGDDDELPWNSESTLCGPSGLLLTWNALQLWLNVPWSLTEDLVASFLWLYNYIMDYDVCFGKSESMMLLSLLDDCYWVYASGTAISWIMMLCFCKRLNTLDPLPYDYNFYWNWVLRSKIWCCLRFKVWALFIFAFLKVWVLASTAFWVFEIEDLMLSFLILLAGTWVDPCFWVCSFGYF